MQQTKSYWRIVAVAGVVGACLASACVVTTSTDDGLGGGTSSAGASTSTAGSPSAGANAGGSGGISGSTSIAGSSNVAGTSGSAGAGSKTPFQCDPSDGSAVGTAASCMTGATDDCSTCMASSCCTEYGQCYATSPGNQCGYGGPTGDGLGEFHCIQACIIAATSDGGVPDDSTIETCANTCVTPADSTGTTCSAALGSQTSALVGCLNMNCQTKCFGGGG